jgi:hypothetical protein
MSSQKVDTKESSLKSSTAGRNNVFDSVLMMKVFLSFLDWTLSIKDWRSIMLCLCLLSHLAIVFLEWVKGSLNECPLFGRETGIWCH